MNTQRYWLTTAALLAVLGTTMASAKPIDWDQKLVKERQLVATNNIEEAMKILDDYLVKHQDVGALHTDKGKCLKKRGRTGEARTEFQVSTQVDPDYAEAWYELGAIQQSDKDYDAAAKSFDQYLQLNPGATNRDAVKERINFCKTNSQ
jgi:tetratricopeptide (TPR) repeat protein